LGGEGTDKRWQSLLGSSGFRAEGNRGRIGLGKKGELEQKGKGGDFDKSSGNGKKGAEFHMFGGKGMGRSSAINS